LNMSIIIKVRVLYMGSGNIELIRDIRSAENVRSDNSGGCDLGLARVCQ